MTIKKELIIALDAMGGDNGVKAIVSAASKALKESKDLKFLFFGDKDYIAKEVSQFGNLSGNYEIFHTDQAISSNDTPAYALRNSRRSSMRLAIEAVKSNDADAIISAGNTGALMAISKIVLRTMGNIDRPAICGIIPTLKGKAVMLDMGANIDCTATNLVQFALMGSAFAKIILKLDNPKLAILNVGSEEIKGSDKIKLASQEIRELKEYINFCGYVEGDGITQGLVDVIVTDGFSGNIALKTAEGTARLCREFMKQSFETSIFAKIGYLLAKRSLKTIFSRLDHRYYNGAMLIGLDGIVVKSHGSSDDIANASAISVASNLARNQINRSLYEALDKTLTIEGLLE